LENRRDSCEDLDAVSGQGESQKICAGLATGGSPVSSRQKAGVTSGHGPSLNVRSAEEEPVEKRRCRHRIGCVRHISEELELDLILGR
jgi:hypothetical protein